MKIEWQGPDAEGIISALGVKRLPFEHQGRKLEVRAVYSGEHAEWIVAAKEGDRFVAPADAFILSSEKIYDAKAQGGVFAKPTSDFYGLRPASSGKRRNKASTCR